MLFFVFVFFFAFRTALFIVVAVLTFHSSACHCSFLLLRSGICIYYVYTYIVFLFLLLLLLFLSFQWAITALTHVTRITVVFLFMHWHHQRLTVEWREKSRVRGGGGRQHQLVLQLFSDCLPKQGLVTIRGKEWKKAVNTAQSASLSTLPFLCLSVRELWGGSLRQASRPRKTSVCVLVAPHRRGNAADKASCDIWGDRTVFSGICV